MAVCKSCNNPVAEGKRFCSRCGQEVDWADEAATEPTEASDSATCADCGAPLNGSPFCTNCGRQSKPADAAPPSSMHSSLPAAPLQQTAPADFNIQSAASDDTPWNGTLARQQGGHGDVLRVLVFVLGLVVIAAAAFGFYKWKSTRDEVVVATPLLSRSDGSAGNIIVTITDSTPGAIIHYTVDNSHPTPESNAYLSPITVPPGTTLDLRAIATVNGSKPSPEAFGVFVVAAPVVLPAAENAAPSEMSAATDPSSDTTGNETDLKVALARWATTMQSNQPAQIAACYADHVDRYFLQQNMDRAQIQAYLVRWFLGGRKRIENYQLSDIVMESMDASSASVSLMKDYLIIDPSGTKHIVNRAELHLLRQPDGTWLITYERDFKQGE